MNEEGNKIQAQHYSICSNTLLVTSMATDCNAFRRMMGIIPPKHFIHTSVKDLCTTT
jgi:hypothetical protein